MPFEVTPDELKSARNIGFMVGRRWSQVEVEDLRSHLTLWLFEHGEQVERFRVRENGRAQLALSLKREALRYCTKEAAARSGRMVERDNFYTPEVVERALPFLFQAEFEVRVRQDPHTGKALERPFSTGDAWAIITDIKRAFDALPPQNQMVLELRFRDDKTLEDIGRQLEIAPKNIHQSVARSVQLMSEFLSR